MLWKDFRAQDLECEDCPLYIEGLCKPGHAGPNGYLEDPPCCWFEDDTDMEAECGIVVARNNAIEDEIDRKWKADKERKAKNEIAKKRRNESKWHVWSETHDIKALRKQIAGNLAIINFQRSFASAVNFANSCYGGKRFDGAELPYTDYQLGLLEANKKHKERIAELEAVKKQKLKELNKTRKAAQKG